MTLSPHARAKQLMARHFSLKISSKDERELRLHLAECGICSREYERFLAFAALDPKSASAEQRLAHGLGLGQHESGVPAGAYVKAGALAVALCSLMFFLPPAHYGGRENNPEELEFLARGKLAEKAQAQILAYRFDANHVPSAIGDAIKATDELAFAYINPAGFRKLLVFAVDDKGGIYWYHPAWTDAESNPRAIDIAGGAELRELPEAISQQLLGRQLAIHAIFTNDDLSVRDIEKLVHEKMGSAHGELFSFASNAATPLGLQNAVENIVTVLVE